MPKKNQAAMPKATGQTGPRTAAGKARSSQNARKHGLRAKTPPLMAGESKAAFKTIQQQLIESYEPDGPLEDFHVYQIAMLMLKQTRIWSAETAAFELAELPGTQPPEKAKPLLPPDLMQEKKLLAELLAALDDPVWYGPDAYLKYQLELPEKEKQKRVKEAEEGGYIFPVPWTESAYYDADDLQKLIADLLVIYPLSTLPEKFQRLVVTNEDRAKDRAVHRRLSEASHPFSLMRPLVLWLHQLAAIERKDDDDDSEISMNTLAQMSLTEISKLRPAATERLHVLEQIEADTHAAIAEEAAIAKERRSLERQSIPVQIADICRYQTQTTNELTKAIDRLMSLQAVRKESL